MKIWLNEQYAIEQTDGNNLFGKGNDNFDFIEVYIPTAVYEQDNVIPVFIFERSDKKKYGEFAHNVGTWEQDGYTVFKHILNDFVLAHKGNLDITIKLNFLKYVDEKRFIDKTKNLYAQGVVLNAIVVDSEAFILSDEPEAFLTSLKYSLNDLNARIENLDMSDNVANLENNILQLNTNLNELKNTFKNKETRKLITNLEWEIGTIGASGGGTYDDADNRLRTVNRYHVLPGSKITTQGIRFEVDFYNRYGQYIDYRGWIDNSISFDEEAYIAILLESNELTAIDALTIELYEPVFQEKEMLMCSLNEIGDCIVVRDKLTNDNTILIDCGMEQDFPYINNFLVKNNIRKIDWFLISHYHSDHTGNFANLLNSSLYDFKNCVFILPPKPTDEYMANDSEVYNEYHKVINTLLEKQYTAVLTTDDLYFKQFFTQDSMIQIYNYDHSDYYKNNLNYNNMCICHEFNFENKRILLTGDLGYHAQNNIINQIRNVDVLKVPHHGGDGLDETSIEFYDCLNAKILVSSSPASENYDYVFNKENGHSAVCKYALANYIPNYLTRFVGDIKIEINDDISINGKSYYTNLTLNEFYKIKNIN